MKQKQQIIIPIILAGIIIACIFMITNNKSKKPTKEIITYTNTTEIKTTTENTITATEEMTTYETTEEITTTEEQKTTAKTNNSSSGNYDSSSNKTQNTLNTNKETTKAQTTKPVVTTEKTTTYDSYYDTSRHSVGYVTFNDPHGTSEDSAYWTTCVRECTWCEGLNGSCETCYIDKEIYGFTGDGQWHFNTTIISPSAENINTIKKVAYSQEPNFDGEYEGQPYKLKFWVWDPC